MHFMTSLMNKIFAFFRRYKNLVKLVDQQTTFKTQIKSVLGSFVITLIMIALPMLITINMFIYAKHTVFLSYIMLALLIVGVLLYFAIYYKLLKNYHQKLEEINTKVPMLVEGIGVSLVVLIFGIIAISVAL